MAGASSNFSNAEKQAMRDRARENREFKKLPGEEQVKRKVAEMDPHDRELFSKLNSAILDAAPQLEIRTWYGMPAYYLDDQVVCFFQAGSQFKTRYATLGFQQAAKLDEAGFWPTSYAVETFNPTIEAQIKALVARATAG